MSLEWNQKIFCLLDADAVSSTQWSNTYNSGRAFGLPTTDPWLEACTPGRELSFRVAPDRAGWTPPSFTDHEWRWPLCDRLRSEEAIAGRKWLFAFYSPSLATSWQELMNAQMLPASSGGAVR